MKGMALIQTRAGASRSVQLLLATVTVNPLACRGGTRPPALKSPVLARPGVALLARVFLNFKLKLNWKSDRGAPHRRRRRRRGREPCTCLRAATALQSRHLPSLRPARTLPTTPHVAHWQLSR